MRGWYSRFGLAADPFDESSSTWTYYYGANYGLDSVLLERLLEGERGVVVVSGAAGTGKSALVANALARAEVYAQARISAAKVAPAAVLDALIRTREPLGASFSATRKRAVLMAMIAQATASGQPIVCVVDDAEHARAGQLKDLLAAIEALPEARPVFQLVLVGRPALLATLEARMLAGLAARVTARIQTRSLSTAELGELLHERLEFAGVADPCAMFPGHAIAAITERATGAVGPALALARAAFEHAATSEQIEVNESAVAATAIELGVDSAGGPWWSPASWSPARRLAASATAAVVVLAVTLAGAQMELIGSNRRHIEADLGALVGTLAATSERPERRLVLAQAGRLGTPRERFLKNDRKDQPETYEVEIKPPQRPGTESAAAAAASPTSSAGRTAVTIPGIPGPLTPPATDAEAARNARLEASATGPFVALQVGAFRELASANALRNELSRSFEDVYLSTIDSGGEPLHRVRIGRFQSPDDTIVLKSQLQAAGYPSFRVIEP